MATQTVFAARCGATVRRSWRKALMRSAIRSKSLFVLLCALIAGITLSQIAEARFPHGGWVSRDFALIGNQLWVVSMEDGQGAGQMTLWAFDASPQAPTSNSSPSGPCVAPCEQRHVTTSIEQQMYSSPGISPDGGWVVFGTKDQKLQSVYNDGDQKVKSEWSAQRMAELRCDLCEGPLLGHKDRSLKEYNDEKKYTKKFCKTIKKDVNNPEHAEICSGQSEFFQAKPTNEEKAWFKDGFHSRPLHMTYDDRDVFVAVNVGGSNAAFLHILELDTNKKLQPFGWQSDPGASLHTNRIPFPLEGASGYLFDLIAHECEIGQAGCECTDNHSDCFKDDGKACGSDDSGCYFRFNRLYLAADDSDSKSPHPIREVELSGDAESPELKTIWSGPSGPLSSLKNFSDATEDPYPPHLDKSLQLGARLGGLVLEDVAISNRSQDDCGAIHGTWSDDGACQANLLVYNMNHGVAALALPPPGAGDDLVAPLVWARYLKQVHRTKPVQNRTRRDQNDVTSGNPIIYAEQRQGGVCPGGQARVYRLDAGTGRPSRAEVDSWPDSEYVEQCEIVDGKEECSWNSCKDLPVDEEVPPGCSGEFSSAFCLAADGEACVEAGFIADDHSPRPMFPGCYSEKIGNASFSSPMVNPQSGHIFFGSAKLGDPLYKVNPATPQSAWEFDPGQGPGVKQEGWIHNYSRVGWFDYGPKDGWRTNATFSADGETLYIGSAGGIVYAMDADEPCGLVRWCYDTRGLDSESGKPNGGYCDPRAIEANPDSQPTCCTDLLAEIPKDREPDLQYRRFAHQCATCWNADNELDTCNVVGVRKNETFPAEPLWNGTAKVSELDGGPPHYTFDRDDVVLSDLSDGDVIELQLFDDQGQPGTEICGYEWQWQRGGQSGFHTSFTEGRWDCSSTQESVAINVSDLGISGQPSVETRVRFALFDPLGNESIVWVKLKPL